MIHLSRFTKYMLSVAIVAMLSVVCASAQPGGRGGAQGGRGGAQGARGGQRITQRDSTQMQPKGLTTWRVDERFGTVTPTVPDTVPYLFMNSNLMEGSRGTYNHTGNIGSPRVSRIYNGQQDYSMGSQFIFTRPYDLALGSVNDCVFTNTKSPITNLSWYAQGNKMVGDDRLRANFATNINKNAGIGFKVDYLYGRGYYDHQQHSSVASKVFGSYRGDRYQMHSAYVFDRTRNAENGGLSDDTYITHPEYFSTKYTPADMPVRLSRAFNRMKVNTLFLTHRYNLGYYQAYDPEGNVLVMPAPTDSDSVAVAVRAMFADSATVRKFIPVAGFIHTARVDHSWHSFIDNNSSRNFYYDNFFAGSDSIDDKTRYFAVENTLALEMSEGFKRWVKTGMRIYARHQLQRFALLDPERRMQWDTYNYLTVGAQLMKEQGSLFRYNVLGELRTTGADWGEFNVEGNVRLAIPVRRDTISIYANGYVRNESPAYYYRHYHGTAAWWDNTSLSNVFRSRVDGVLAWRKTRVKVAFETIQNHTYFQEIQSMLASGVTPEGAVPDYDIARVRYGVMAMQADKNVQVLSAALCQDLKFGPVVWENEWTFQQSSDDRVLPLPMLNVWSNLYLHFNVAKVLRTDLGADVRFFTKYYAPAYSPLIGQYAVQDADHRMQIGNYPWVNVYVNFHLKTCRFFVMMSHVNSSAGNYFLAPHYPTNQRTFRFGISWNFFN